MFGGITAGHKRRGHFCFTSLQAYVHKTTIKYESNILGGGEGRVEERAGWKATWQILEKNCILRTFNVSSDAPRPRLFPPKRRAHTDLADAFGGAEHDGIIIRVFARRQVLVVDDPSPAHVFFFFLVLPGMKELATLESKKGLGQSV